MSGQKITQKNTQETTQGKSRFNMKEAALEVTGIVFAVLLALWLESWRDNMELQQRADAARERIRLEIVANRLELVDSISQNEGNMKAITAAIRARGGVEGAGPLIDKIGPYLAISSSALSDSAWTSAKVTEVLARMPADEVTVLAGLYDTQGYYRDYARFFMRQYTDLTIDIQQDEQAAEKAARKFVQHLALLNSIGQQLVAAYDEYLPPSGVPAAD